MATTAALFNPKLPISPAAQMGAPAPTRVERAAADVQKFGTDIAEKQKELGAFEAEQAGMKAEQTAQLAKQRAESLGAERKAIEESVPFQDLQQVEKEAATARFEPTQRSIQENAALFSLIGVLGFAIGAGSKSNAMQAMSGLNGMLKGVQEGDMDRYKKEKTTFDTNLKALVQRSNVLTTQVKRITELAARDKEKANLEMDALLAKEQAGFVKQYKDKYGLPATIKYLEQQQKGAQQALTLAQRAEDQAMQKARDQEFQRQQEKDRRLFQATLQDERLRRQEEMQRERMTHAEKVSELRGVGGPRSATNERYANTVYRAGNEVMRSLELVEQIGITTGGGLLGSVVGKRTIPTELQRGLSQYLTDEQQKNYNTAMSGIALELAYVLNGGYKPDLTTVNKIETLLSVGPNDTAGNAAYKFADVVAKLKAAVEVSPAYTKDQQEIKSALTKKFDKYAAPETVYERQYGVRKSAEPAVRAADSAASQPTHTLRKRPIVVKDNKWVFADTGEEAK